MKIETLLDHHRILGNAGGPVLFSVRLVAPVAPKLKLKVPMACCVALDAGASMAGGAFDPARRFVRALARHWDDESLFALLRIGEYAETLHALEPLADRAAFGAYVGELHASESGRCLASVWLLAREELRKAPAELPRKIILVSDGREMFGEEDEEMLLELARGGAGEGIGTSVVAAGAEANVPFLREVAKAGDGAFHSLADECDHGIVEVELGRLRPVTVHNVRVRLRALDFCDGIEVLGAHKEQASRRGEWHEFALGDFVAGEEKSISFNLSVPQLPLVNGESVITLEGEAMLALEVVYDEMSAGGIEAQRWEQTIWARGEQTASPVAGKAKVAPLI